VISNAFWFQAIDSNATSMDISQVHIVFQRHAESSHNIRNPNAPDFVTRRSSKSGQSCSKSDDFAKKS
jgi:hypothetical protein